MLYIIGIILPVGLVSTKEKREYIFTTGVWFEAFQPQFHAETKNIET